MVNNNMNSSVLSHIKLLIYLFINLWLNIIVLFNIVLDIPFQKNIN